MRKNDLLFAPMLRGCTKFAENYLHLKARSLTVSLRRCIWIGLRHPSRRFHHETSDH